MTAVRPPAGPIVLTYDDYRRLPADARRYELWEGVLRVAPAPSPRHQDVSRNLVRVLDRHVFITVVQPDILYLSRDRLHLVTEHNIAGAPDLVIEILSPSTAPSDRPAKAQLYARHGMPHLCLVDPHERTLEAYRLEGGAYRLDVQVAGTATFKPALFPGLRIDLAELWE